MAANEPQSTTSEEPVVEQAYDRVANEMVGRWEAESGLMTIGEAVLAALKNRFEDGDETPISEDEWSAFAATASFWAVRSEARELGIDFYWDAEVARTPEGFYQVRGGLDYAIRKSLSVAPYADLVWMETAALTRWLNNYCRQSLRYRGLLLFHSEIRLIPFLGEVSDRADSPLLLVFVST